MGEYRSAATRSDVSRPGKTKFITNDVTHDPRVHDHDWARKIGLVSFAGYRLLSAAGKPIGVLALFSKHIISPDEDALLEGLANTTAQVIQTARAEQEREQLILELQDALAKVKTLSGLLPICAYCKKIRDDQGYWNQLETYIQEHSDAEFSHGICDECGKKLYPEIFEDDEEAAAESPTDE